MTLKGAQHIALVYQMITLLMNETQTVVVLMEDVIFQ